MVLESSVITDNIISGAAPNAAVISVNAVAANNLYLPQQDSILYIQQSDITGSVSSWNMDPYPVYQALVFSDANLTVRYNGVSGFSQSLSEVPPGRPFISDNSSSDVPVTVTQVCSLPALQCTPQFPSEPRLSAL